ARLDHDLFGSGDSLLRFRFQDTGGRGAGFLDGFGRFGIRLRHHLLALGLGPVQFGLDLFGIRKPLGNLLAPLFQHGEDAPVSELVEYGAYDTEADDLRAEVRPVHTESPGYLLDLPATLLRRE